MQLKAPPDRERQRVAGLSLLGPEGRARQQHEVVATRKTGFGAVGGCVAGAG